MKIKPIRRHSEFKNELIPYFARWQCNNSPDDLGIVRFFFDLYEINKSLYGKYPNYVPLVRDFNPKYGVAPWAREALAEYFYWEEGMTKDDRCFAYATFREGTKTTWFSYFLVIYETLIGQFGIYYKDQLLPEVDYQILRSKTGGEAEKRLMAISSFYNKDIVQYFFGDLKPSFQEVKLKDAKDTTKLLILRNSHIFHASGIDQPVRGANILQARPKKVTFDDVQTRENVKTPGRRQQVDMEVIQETFPGLHEKGSLIYIANKTHEDDTLGKLLDERNKQWKKQFHTLTIKKNIDGTIEPGTGDLDHEVPAWPARDTIESIRKRKEWFLGQPKFGGLRGYLKEYYNIIKTDVNYQIKWHNATYMHKFGVNWLVFDTTNGKEYVNCRIIISVDPAISKNKTASNSDAVISAVAFTPDRRRYVLQSSAGKFDTFDEYIDPSQAPEILAVESRDMANVRKRGSCAEAARYFINYHADGMVVETEATQLIFLQVIQKILNQLGYKPTIMPHSDRSESKEEKNRACPLIYFEEGLYYFREGMTREENEIITFPNNKQDFVDTLRLAEQLYRLPKHISYNPLGIHNVAVEEELKNKYNYVVKMEKIKEPGRLTTDYESWVV
jgi:hypothetical protein